MKWLVGLTILIASLCLFIIFQRGEQSDIALSYRYAVEDIDAIEKIKIDYRLMNPDIVLEKKSDYWQLNNKYRAREDAIANLLDAIQGIELRFIPRPAGKQTMLKDLATTGTKVEIFGKNDQLIQAYFIGGNTSDDRATFIIKAGTQDPAAVGLAGFEGTIGTRFVMPATQWRDRIVFREIPDQIEELTVDYPAQPLASFALRKQDGEMVAYPLRDDQEMSDLVQKRGAIEAYLQNYKSVGAESILLNKDLTSTLWDTEPFVQISLRRSDHTNYWVRLYPIHVDPAGTVRDQIERYHLLDSKGDLYLIQHRVFQKLFLDKDFFFTDSDLN